MQVDQAIMALSLLNAELVVQRDEARGERDALKEQIARQTLADAQAKASTKPARKR